MADQWEFPYGVPTTYEGGYIKDTATVAAPATLIIQASGTGWCRYRNTADPRLHDLTVEVYLDHILVGTMNSGDIWCPEVQRVTLTSAFIVAQVAAGPHLIEFKPGPNLWYDWRDRWNVTVTAYSRQP